MGWTYNKNERQQMDKAENTVATQEREEVQRTTNQKVAGGHH